MAPFYLTAPPNAWSGSATRCSIFVLILLYFWFIVRNNILLYILKNSFKHFHTGTNSHVSCRKSPIFSCKQTKIELFFIRTTVATDN